MVSSAVQAGEQCAALARSLLLDIEPFPGGWHTMYASTRTTLVSSKNNHQTLKSIGLHGQRCKSVGVAIVYGLFNDGFEIWQSFTKS